MRLPSGKPRPSHPPPLSPTPAGCCAVAKRPTTFLAVAGMGCSGSRPTEEAEDEKQKDDEINKDLRKQAQKMESECKLLLLGSGESGKSTLAKQLKIIHLSGFTPEELAAYKEIVQANALQSMKVLIAASSKLNIPIEIPENRVRAERVMLVSDALGGEDAEASYNASLGKDISSLWKDTGIKTVYAKRSQFQINDSAEYFFANVERLFLPNYSPSVKDVLHSRVKTTGITEMNFCYNGVTFRIVDVGGQRSERKKWIHCFTGVTAIIFVTSLSEYDQLCFEDNSTNRMKESLLLFDDICNNRWFTDTPVILFLNKVDLFEQKLRAGIDLKVCFPSYTGGLNSMAAKKFIADRFVELNKNQNKRIYTHFTCAMDTDNIRYVWAFVQDILLSKILAGSGML